MDDHLGLINCPRLIGQNFAKKVISLLMTPCCNGAWLEQQAHNNFHVTKACLLCQQNRVIIFFSSFFPGLMKFLAKGRTDRIIEDSEEKIKSLLMTFRNNLQNKYNRYAFIFFSLEVWTIAAKDMRPTIFKICNCGFQNSHMLWPECDCIDKHATGTEARER